METIKFILIDDNEAYRCALQSMLNSKFNALIIAEASNADEAKQLENLHQADIILMDVMMPGQNGIELTKKLLWYYNKLKVIAITMDVEKVYLTTLIEAGFKGCIFKNDLANNIDEAVNIVMNGKLFFPRDIILDFNKDTNL